VNNRGHVEAADTGKRDGATQKSDGIAKLSTQIQRAVFAGPRAWAEGLGAAFVAARSRKRNRKTGE
jgi:hypothetical protein